VFSIRITIDGGTPIVIPNFATLYYSSGISANGSLPCMIKCNASFKLEVMCTGVSANIGYAASYAI
jgi:hypothetical protein